jgi:hypothetical protein
VDYIASDDLIIDEKSIGRCLETNEHGPIEVLYWNLPGRTEENHE